MDNKLVDLLRETIDKKYVLERQERYWILEDETQSCSPIKIRSASRNYFAFSLDREKPKPFAFFSPNPSNGIAKMCDAIMACHHKSQCYLFLIEMKTTRSGSYKKQVTNGKLFCDWLLQLYEKNGHNMVHPIFVSLLIWSPRQQPAKRGTTHHDASVTAADKGIFDHSFKITNQSMIPMFDLFKKIA